MAFPRSLMPFSWDNRTSLTDPRSLVPFSWDNRKRLTDPRSLMPFSWDYPASLTDQHFGTGLFDRDFTSPMFQHGYILRPRTRASMESSGTSEVKNEKDKFKVMLNVSHFDPNEVEVKVVDNFVVIHGKHEEKTDEHGFIQREFTRRYMLPEGAEAENVRCSWSPTGVLTIEAPKKAIEAPSPNERVVPIAMSGQAEEDKKST